MNRFTIGIEFQGNTLEKPLTDEQIESAIDYLLPIIKKYNIPTRNIVTHEKVRADWLKHHPDRKMVDANDQNGVPSKSDITSKEYARFMAALKERL